MFDTYLPSTISINSKISVTENRAPTDQSVKLLMELREEALKDIIHAERLTGNILDGVVIQRRLGITGKMELIVCFKLNNIEYIVPVEVNGIDFKIDKIQAYQHLLKILTEKIMGHLFTQVLQVMEGK